MIQKHHENGDQDALLKEALWYERNERTLFSELRRIRRSLPAALCGLIRIIDSYDDEPENSGIDGDGYGHTTIDEVQIETRVRVKVLGEQIRVLRELNGWDLAGDE